MASMPVRSLRSAVPDVNVFLLTLAATHVYCRIVDVNSHCHRVPLRALGAAAALAVATGCGGSTSNAPADGGTDAAASLAPDTGTYQSGSRLRAHLWAGDGASLFVGWRDTQLGADCTFTRMADGGVFCLPTDATPFTRDEATYLDPACTQAVVDASLGSRKYFFAMSGWQSCAGGNLVEVDQPAVQSVNLGTLYTLGDAGCSAMAMQSSFALGRPLQPVPLATFVGARVVLESRGATLAGEVYVADDDTRQLGAIHDSAHGDACGDMGDVPPFFSGALSEHCLPLSRTDPIAAPASTNVPDGGTEYGSMTCSTPIPGDWGCFEDQCGAPAWSVFDTNGCSVTDACTTCTPANTVLTLGAPATSPLWVLEGDQGCQPSSIGDVCHFHPATGSVPLAVFPLLGSAHKGSGRFQNIVRTATDDPRPLAERATTLWDTVTSSTCSSTEFADGKTRCMTDGTADINSGGVATSIIYADPSCTEELVEGTPCGPAPLFARTVPDTGGVIVVASAGVATKLYQVGPPFPGPTYQLTSSGCALRDTTAPVFRIGPQVDPDAAFGVLTERIE
jgi:hypothetical protein